MVCASAMESTERPRGSGDEHHSDYYHSVVVKGHVKESDSYGPRDPVHRPPVTSPDDQQPALTIAESPSRESANGRRSREYYQYYQHPPVYSYYDDGDGDYYTGVEATYHPLATWPPHHEATQRSRGLVTHHGGIVRGPFGFAGHHSGHLRGPFGFVTHHGGLIKTHSGLAGHHTNVHHNRLGGHVSHGGFHLLGRSASPSPLPAVPGLIRGGAAVAVYNSQDHGKEELVHGQGTHKYKHFSVDRGFVNPCAVRPFHVVHADHGYDSNIVDVGGGGYGGVGNVYGLGGKLGIL